MNSFLWILFSAKKKVLRLADVELHKNYAIVITTNSGLWRYLIGDTVRFTLNPFKIRVTGRTKHHINVLVKSWLKTQIRLLPKLAV
jgi:hypothetical protein